MVIAVTGAPVLGEFSSVAVPAHDWVASHDCPVCGTATHVEEVARVEAESPGPVLSACLDCEHLFKSRRPSRAWIDRFYAGDWDARGRDEMDGRSIEPDAKVLAFCSNHLPPRAHVLDVGAGFGAQLLSFREAGHQVEGLESSEHRARYVAEQLGIPCAASALEDAALTGAMDLVFSNHVLEHIDEPRGWIEAAVARLGSAGHLYLAVPHWSSEYPPQLFHFIPHMGAFSERSIERLLRQSGMRPVKMNADRELQVLAARDDGAGDEQPPSTAASRAAFRERVTEWALAAVGRGGGGRTLAWWTSTEPQRWYEFQVYDRSPLAFARLKAFDLARKAIPGPIRRRLAGAVSESTAKGNLKLIPVRVSGPGELPIVFRHPGADPPAWVA